MTCDGLTCTCATCPAPHTPGVIDNRPGLSEIAFRSGTHGDFLAAMLEAIPTGGGRPLAALRTRDLDDPTIALLDAFAVVCDVLTFYSERLANEGFLGTATERISLQELGALVAYRLGRGAAAQTTLAFTLERPPVLPSRANEDPGVLPPDVPRTLMLPVGLRVQSVPGPGEKPQMFETIESIEARPEWNALPVVRTAPLLPVEGATTAYFTGDALGLAPGDAVLFPGSSSGGAGLRLLDVVDAEHLTGRTRVQWSQALTAPAVGTPVSDTWPTAFAMRRRFAVFGHNAPAWKTMGLDFRLAYQGVATADLLDDEWPDFDAVTVSGGTTTVVLEGAHPEIAVGSWVVLAAEGTGTRRLFSVSGRAEASRSQFAVSGRATTLTLSGDGVDFGSPRDVTVYGVADPLTFAEAPDTAPVDSTSVVVEGDAAAMAAGRRILLVGTSGGEPAVAELVVEAAETTGVKRTLLTLRAAPDHEFDRATAVVFGNAVHATHGETTAQLLGSGDARVPFAATELARDPLTFVPADTPRGIASTLEVRVDDVRWDELPTTAIAGPRDRVFETRDETDGGLSVVFGDGIHGARPGTGINNVKATYRVGIGVAGNVAADALSMPIDRPLGLKAVTNPAAAIGGVDPETQASARRSIPVPVLTLGRVVSRRDYADFALAFSGIGMADAAILPLRGGPVVIVSVADEEGAPPPQSTLDRLDAELTRYGDPGARHRVVPCRTGLFRIALSVVVDPARTPAVVGAAVEAALRAAFAAPARGIARAVERSAVIALAASVPGVLGVDLDRLYRTAGFPSLQPRLVPQPVRAVGVNVRGAEILSVSPDPFDWLEVRT